MFRFIIFSLILGVIGSSAMARPKKVSGKNAAISNECILEDVASAGLGDVKFSILSETQFQTLHGTSWVLLKGQSKSSLGIGTGEPSVFDYLLTSQNTSTTNLPDARGVFLRGKNNNPIITEFNNPSGDLLIGAWTDDKFETHSHRTEKFSDRGYPDGSGDRKSNYYLMHPNKGKGFDLGTSAVGANETAPKSLTVNIFVKVKRDCIDAVTIANIRAVEQRIVAIEGYTVRNVCDVCLTLPEADLTELRAKNNCFKTEIDNFENDTSDWSVSCQARTIGYSKKVLMLIGAANRTQAENDFLSHLDNQYPYYNVIESSIVAR